MANRNRQKVNKLKCFWPFIPVLTIFQLRNGGQFLFSVEETEVSGESLRPSAVLCQILPRQIPQEEQELSYHPSSLPVVSSVRVTQSLVFCLLFLEHCLSFCLFLFL